jgi:Family of unknown function (DUF6719)
MRDTHHINRLPILLLAALALWPIKSSAMEQQVSREQDIVNLRLGERIRVDDGSCPTGKIKEVAGTKMSASGIVRTRKCVPRLNH